jgi:serine/threonine protein kinase
LDTPQDIKPSNLLLDDSNLRITDFGAVQLILKDGKIIEVSKQGDFPAMFD